MNRGLAAVLVAVVVAFGGGYLLAKGIDGTLFHPAGGVHGQSAWPFFGHPRDANAPRAGPVKPTGFAIWQTRLDTSGADPLACIQMSEPLDPSKSYSDFVLVSPDLGHAPAVSVKGTDNDTLCVGGVGLTDRQITLLKGLPAKGGDTLAANADATFAGGDQPAYVGFSGNGVILPREDSDGVGIETVNVSKVHIEVWRVVDRNLVRKSISAPDPTPEGTDPGDYGDDSPDDEGSMVWKGDVDIKGDPGVHTTTVFPLGAVLHEMKPGGYVIKVRDATGGRTGNSDEAVAPAQARRWIIFTDMALTSYTGQDALDVVVRSLKTAQIMSGVQVSLMATNGETLGTANTDSMGRASFPHRLLEGDGALVPKMVMAYGAQGDLALLDLSRSPTDLTQLGSSPAGGPSSAPDITGRTAADSIDGYLYADRGIYRPGETVHLTSLIRDRQAKAVNDRKGYVVVLRPSGLEYKRYTFDSTAGGALATDIVLPASAPRGKWTANLQIDGFHDPAGTVDFQVQDFAPQRLAVTADGQAAVPVSATETRNVVVTASFLYGAVGSGLQTQGEARLKPDPNPFPDPSLAGYQWGDDTAPFDEKEVDLGTTVTDGQGHANLALPGNSAGDTVDPVIALVTASVFEPGGRPVAESVTLKLRPLPLYLGVKVDEGASSGDSAPPVALDIVGVNGAGQRIAAPGVSYSLISENWSYDWFQQDGKWQWRRTSRDTVVTSGTIDVGTGAPAAIRPRKLGWGDYRLELTGPNGAKTISRFTVGWGAPASDTEAPDVARIAAGSQTYGQGDSVAINVTAPYGGEAQVAVVTDHLIDFQTFQVGKDGGTIHLKTSADWGGGAYVLVTVIQPRDPVATPTPRRALGLLYVPLDPKNRKLTVGIGTPDKIDSKAQVVIPVQVQGLALGQTAHVTVAAVDEGILRLTKTVSPDPVGWYFGKHALTIDYRDDYGRLLDPNLGAPVNVNFGGDQLGGEGLTVTPIKTVALWSGIVTTGIDGKATVTLPAADFNGELRIMAVAWNDTQVGSADKDLTVRQPVIADLDLPRFLAPGDKPIATLELQNLEGQPGAYQAVMRAAGGIVATFQQVFNLIVGQRMAPHIPFFAPGQTGIGSVGFTLTGPGFTTSKDYPIQTRLGWGPITRTTTELQQAGETYTPPDDLVSGLAAGGNATLQVQVSYSPFKGFDPGPIAVSLYGYPYGCTEQVVSTAFPLLYAQALSTDPKATRTAPAALNDAVGMLLDRESQDGAFGLWRVGDGEADPWLGAYATDFLIEAKNAGAAVPQSAIDAALNAMRQVSLPDSNSSVSYMLTYPDWWGGNPDASKAATARMRSRASAYALYVLAKGGRGDLARLRWWHDVQMKSEGSPLAMAQDAAGLAMMGDVARARDAMQHAADAVGYRRPLLQLGPIMFVDDQDWYQSPLRDLAGVIALAYEANMPDIAHSLEGRLDGAVTDPDALNTQEKAQLLRAAHFMLVAAGPISIQANGALVQQATAGLTPRWAVNGRLADAHFVNGGHPLWRTVTVYGTPLAPPDAAASGVQVTKTYFTYAGQPVDLAAVKQGDRIIIRIAGSSSQGRTVPLAINDALPAGFEIDSVLGPDDAAKGPFKFLGDLTTPDGQESRDDRYVAALDLAGGKTFALAYVVRAVTPGDFYLPGAEILDMYHAGVNARTAGGRVQISPAGG